MKPIDPLFTEQSERICIEVATEQGRHNSRFSIEVVVQPHAQIRVCWGDNTTTTYQQHSDRLTLEHNYPNYNRGGGIRFSLYIEVEEGASFISLIRNFSDLNVLNVDLTACPRLSYLHFSKLKGLKFPSQNALTELYLSEYDAEFLDLSSARKLQIFKCKFSSHLKSIDLRNSTLLHFVDLSYSVDICSLKLPNRCNLSELHHNGLALSSSSMRYVRDLLRANKGEEVIEILYPLSMIRERMPNFSLDKWYKTASSLTVERIRYDD